MDREQVARWLERYVEAWRANDGQVIGNLFTEDAQYRWHPWDEPVRGREAIVAGWLEDPDDPGSWDASYEPVAVDGDVAVARGVSRYFKDGALDRTYHNIFLIRFDDAGRCREFTEWYMKESVPETAAQPAS
ncbi:MAG: nuclear transport factor 2 family protein [Chloroflexota bacterium]|nr:nuclear transport factor 2 family protein [Chloroflexota bacterium]